MPTYEYRCPKGHEFELFQRMSDEPRADCPHCGLGGERLLSGGAGFLFKGDGFYTTDYRSDSYKKDASDEKSGASSDKKTDEGSKKADKAQAGTKETKDPSPASSSNGDASTGKA
jgi:putative FmdB family regulatory protein